MSSDHVYAKLVELTAKVDRILALAEKEARKGIPRFCCSDCRTHFDEESPNGLCPFCRSKIIGQLDYDEVLDREIAERPGHAL
jgi:Zn finger protein HypA/HybF involved in hydrogenase expression